MDKKEFKGQISMEYLIIVAFVIFLILGLLGFSYFYSTSVQDTLRINQMSTFANKLLSTAESVFYAGEPSKSTITAYLPKGVTNIQILEQRLVFTYSTASGESKTSFTSPVPISGEISFSEGVQVIQVVAVDNEVRFLS